MGTDVTEFKQPWGKAYFAPVYDFGSKEIVAWSTSLHPNMAQQDELLVQAVAQKAEGPRPGPPHPLSAPSHPPASHSPSLADWDKMPFSLHSLHFRE